MPEKEQLVRGKPLCEVFDDEDQATISGLEENLMQAIKDVANNDEDLHLSLNQCSTNLKTKGLHFMPWVKLVRNQFIHGGAKYKGTAEKEFTDLICEAFPGESGVDFVLATMMKYLGRYKNFGREKDILKVAAYCYILWLKAGFHLVAEHDEDMFVR